MAEFNTQEIMSQLVSIQSQLTMIEQRLSSCEGALFRELEFLERIWKQVKMTGGF